MTYAIIELTSQNVIEFFDTFEDVKAHTWAVYEFEHGKMSRCVEELGLASSHASRGSHPIAAASAWPADDTGASPSPQSVAP